MRASPTSTRACHSLCVRDHDHDRRRLRRRRSAEVERAIRDSDRTKIVEVITFDLDDTLWPTREVVNEANDAFREFCARRLGDDFPSSTEIAEGMKGVREEREREARERGRRSEPLSYAGTRIAGALKAAKAKGINEHDAAAVIARGYHLAWIPTRNAEAGRLAFVGAREALAELRATYPRAVIGSITNGFGSAAGAGLGEFFDFEISAEALIDEHMVHGEMARKPHAYPFQLALGIACGEHGYSGDSDTWVHVGDDILNDCYCAKQLDLRTVHVKDPGVKPYVSAGGAPDAEVSMRDTVEANASTYVDGVISHVRELPALLATWYA